MNVKVVLRSCYAFVKLVTIYKTWRFIKRVICRNKLHMDT